LVWSAHFSICFQKFITPLQALIALWRRLSAPFRKKEAGKFMSWYYKDGGGRSDRSKRRLQLIHAKRINAQTLVPMRP
jgi:hypothetical protein